MRFTEQYKSSKKNLAGKYMTGIVSHLWERRNIYGYTLIGVFFAFIILNVIALLFYTESVAQRFWHITSQDSGLIEEQMERTFEDLQSDGGQNIFLDYKLYLENQMNLSFYKCHGSLETIPSQCFLITPEQLKNQDSRIVLNYHYGEDDSSPYMEPIYIPISEYMNDDVKKQMSILFKTYDDYKNASRGYWTVDRMEYYESDQKIIPTKIWARPTYFDHQIGEYVTIFPNPIEISFSDHAPSDVIDLNEYPKIYDSIILDLLPEDFPSYSNGLFELDLFHMVDEVEIIISDLREKAVEKTKIENLGEHEESAIEDVEDELTTDKWNSEPVSLYHIIEGTSFEKRDLFYAYDVTVWTITYESSSCFLIKTTSMNLILEACKQYCDGRYLIYIFLVTFGIGLLIILIANFIYGQNKRIEEKNRIFVRAAAHDFRTPIVTILGYCELAMYDIDNVKGNGKILNRIYEKAGELNKRLDELLNFLKASSLKRIDFEPVSLSEIVALSINNHEGIIKQYKDKISLHVAIDEDVIVRGRKEYLQTVINNFVSNALKYASAPEDSIPQIYIHLKQSGKRFHLEIYNDCLEKIDTDRIWEPLYTMEQARNATPRFGQSTGLGFVITKEILEVHNFNYSCQMKKDGILFNVSGKIISEQVGINKKHDN